MSGISVLLGVLNYGQLDSYLISRLFKSDEVALTAFSGWESVRECCNGFLPSELACYHKRRKQVVMEKVQLAL